MTRKKKLKRAIRARAEAEGVSYQAMFQRFGFGALRPTPSVADVADAIRRCLRAAPEPPADVDRLAAQVARDAVRLRTEWKARSSDPQQDYWVFARALTEAVCDGLEGLGPRPKDWTHVRAPARPDPDSRTPSQPAVPARPDDFNGISGRDICEVAEDVLVTISPEFLTQPTMGFDQAFGGMIDDYLCPPCDADFEYLSDSDLD